jgi:MATE family multidrug resistance protein
MFAAWSPEPYRLRREIRRMIALAGPVALGELGWMAMTVVDTIMVGRLGPAAIGAAGIGASMFYVFSIFGIGLLLGLDTLVSQSWGAGRRDDCHRSLGQALWLALALTPVIMGIARILPAFFAAWGMDRSVAVLTVPFLLTLSWSTLPLLIYGALRRYLQGIGHVRPVMFALVSANLVNWFGNWLLIEGHWGLPAWGVTGSAFSTSFARIYMALFLAAAIWWIEKRAGVHAVGILKWPERSRIVQLLRLGFPAASQILCEIGAFSAAGVLASNLGASALAAHQIALNCAAVTFMVPLGISSAAAVSVGHAIGSGQPARARRAGYIALGLSCGFMSCAAIAFLVVPGAILRIFTLDPTVIRTGTVLLAIAAAFQLFDGTQTVLTGALRGLGNTRTPMLVNLAGYYVLGLPLGWWLCFRAGYGLNGLWTGLTAALVAIALCLLVEWQRESGHHVEKIV